MWVFLFMHFCVVGLHKACCTFCGVSLLLVYFCFIVWVLSSSLVKFKLTQRRAFVKLILSCSLYRSCRVVSTGMEYSCGHKDSCLSCSSTFVYVYISCSLICNIRIVVNVTVGCCCSFLLASLLPVLLVWRNEMQGKDTSECGCYYGNWDVPRNTISMAKVPE